LLASTKDSSSKAETNRVATVQKEDESKMEESLYVSNGSPSVTYKESKPDKLLMYKAKQNVKDRRNLVKHILVFIAICPVLLIFYTGVVQSAMSNAYWDFISAIGILSSGIPYTADYINQIYDHLLWLVDLHFFRGYTPGYWYVLMGIMLAWFGWIMQRIFRRVYKRVYRLVIGIFRGGSAGKERPDPVMQEYKRLKGLAEFN
jgi:hypothetical protein